METKLTLTSEHVTVTMGSKSKIIANDDFYSGRSKVYKHIDMQDVNEMFPTPWFVIENNKNELITLEAMTDNKSKLTQIQPGDSLRFHYDSFYYDSHM